MSVDNDIDNLIHNLVDQVAGCNISEFNDTNGDDDDSNHESGAEDEEVNDQEGEVEEDRKRKKDSNFVQEELDRKNPAYVPKRGGFYEHDPRFDGNDDARNDESDQQKTKNLSSSRTYVDKLRKWKHDMFDVQEQSPKSRNQLFHEYGYDIERTNDQDRRNAVRRDNRRSNVRQPKKFPNTDVHQRSRASYPPNNQQQEYRKFQPHNDFQQNNDDNRPSNRSHDEKSQYTKVERHQHDHVPRNEDSVEQDQHHHQPSRQNYRIPKMEFRRRTFVNSDYAAAEQHQQHRQQQQQPPRYSMPPRFAKNARNFETSRNQFGNTRRRVTDQDEEDDVAEVDENVGDDSGNSIQYEYDASTQEQNERTTTQTPPGQPQQQHPKRYSAIRQQQYSNTPPPQTTAPAASSQQLHATAAPFTPQHQQQPQQLAAYAGFEAGIDFQQQYATAGMMAPPPYVPTSYGAAPSPGVLHPYAYQQLLNSLIMQQQHDQQQQQQMYAQVDQLAAAQAAAYYQAAAAAAAAPPAILIKPQPPTGAPPVDPCSTVADGRQN